MKLEVAGLVSKGKVVLGQFRFGSVKSQLVASQPALVAQHSSCMDGGTGHVEVQVAAHIDIVTLVASLQFGTLLATEGITRKEKRESLLDSYAALLMFITCIYMD